MSTLLLKSYLIRCYSEIGQEPTPDEVFHKLDQTVTVLIKFIGG